MRNRRGLSTVVGAVFFVIAATTVISYVSYSMNTIDQFAESVIVKEAENINRGLEDITISQVTIVGGEFNMTVVNTGSLPVHLTRLWVTDDNSAVPDKKADLDVRINPGKEAIKIGEGTGIVADSTISYSLKLVTERGNLATYSVSPDIPLQIQLVSPASAELSKNIRLTAYYTNNSTKPNNVANLIPEMLMNTTTTLTLIDGPTPPSFKTLPQGNTAVVTWTYQAPATGMGISFNASYTGAPTGSFVYSNTTAALAGEAEEAGTSEWSQAAKRVGILISGVPDPVDAGGAVKAKFGIGIINPLDRIVKIYSVGITSPVERFVYSSPFQAEPADGNWSIISPNQNDPSMVIWEGGASPVSIQPFSVGQFRVEAKIKPTNEGLNYILIQALTSEGKMAIGYSIASNTAYPMINTFYTPIAKDPLPNWTYMIENIPSGRTTQVFNATVENASNNNLASSIQLVILIPSDFTNIAGWGANSDWKTPISIVENPDKSTVITVETTANPFLGPSNSTFQFSADVPTIEDNKLYVFQTTTVYPSWTAGIQLSSALSEAGVQVVVP